MMKRRYMIRAVFSLAVLLVSCASTQNKARDRPTHQTETRPWLPHFIRNIDGFFTIFEFKELSIPIQSLGPDSLFLRKDIIRGHSDAQEDLSYTSIINAYTKTVEENPLDFGAHIVLAGLYINRGRPGDPALALTYSERALILRPGDPMAIYIKALAFGALGDYHNALTDLRILKNIVRDQNEIIYYLIAIFEYRAGNKEGAVIALEKALVINPSFTIAREALSLLR